MEFFEFQLKVAGVMALGVIIYYLFLSKDVSFNRNRSWLLTCIAVPWIVPLMAMPVWVKHILLGKTQPVAQFIITENTPVANADRFIVEESLSWQEIAVWLFVAISIFVLIRVMAGYISILKISKGSEKGNFKGLLLRFLTQTHLTPFSFLRTIYAPKAICNHKNYQMILEHEAIHCKQLHSLDIILIEIVLLLQWWNPFAWWLKKLIAQNHEYIVDNKMMQKVEAPGEYQYMLVDWMKGNADLQLVHNFNSSFIKKRIVMMNQNKSNSLIKRLKMAPVIMMMLVSILAFTNAEKTVVANPAAQTLGTDVFLGDNDVVQDTTKHEVVVVTYDDAEPNKKQVKKEVETIVAVIDNGRKQVHKQKVDTVRIAVLGGNHEDVVVSTEVSAESSCETKVVVHDGQEPLVLADDGEVHVEVLKDIKGAKVEKIVVLNADDLLKKADGVLREEMIVVVDKKDADQEDEKDKKAEKSVKTTKMVVKKKGDVKRVKNPLFIVDGEEREGFNPASLSPEEMANVSVFKDEAAIAKYGNKGKNGVVVIETKKYQEQKGEVDRSGSSKANVLVKKRVNVENFEGALIVVDGKEMKDFDVKCIDPANIKSVSVLKGDEAIAAYGKKGKDGVILIETKK